MMTLTVVSSVDAVSVVCVREGLLETTGRKFGFPARGFYIICAMKLPMVPAA